MSRRSIQFLVVKMLKCFEGPSEFQFTVKPGDLEVRVSLAGKILSFKLTNISDGWKIVRINNEPFTKNLLQNKIQGDQDYTITCRATSFDTGLVVNVGGCYIRNQAFLTTYLLDQVLSNLLISSLKNTSYCQVRNVEEIDLLTKCLTLFLGL